MVVMDCIKAALCYSACILEQLHVDYCKRKCLTSRVGFRYKLSRKLVGDRTKKSQLLLDVITESQFADDAALYATSEESSVIVTQSFADVASWCLTVCLVKT